MRRRNGRLVVRRVRTARTREYQETAGWLATAWRLETRWRMPEPGQKIELRYWVYWPDRRRRDPANLLKVLLDALEGVLYQDDSAVLARAMDFAVDRQRPRVEVEIAGL